MVYAQYMLHRVLSCEFSGADSLRRGSALQLYGLGWLDRRVSLSENCQNLKLCNC